MSGAGVPAAHRHRPMQLNGNFQLRPMQLQTFQLPCSCSHGPAVSMLPLRLPILCAAASISRLYSNLTAVSSSRGTAAAQTNLPCNCICQLSSPLSSFCATAYFFSLCAAAPVLSFHAAAAMCSAVLVSCLHRRSSPDSGLPLGSCLLHSSAQLCTQVLLMLPLMLLMLQQRLLQLHGEWCKAISGMGRARGTTGTLSSIIASWP
jgi:hypothetical protein